jgi:DNA-binding HxlR family transcriptional regulator
MKKDSSTNALNQRWLIASCGMAYTLGIIEGRWKPAILCRLLFGPMRYGELKKSIQGISERMLVAQLRDLEKAQIVQRRVYAEVPPRVEYQLTPLGLSMKPVFESMSDWGNAHKPEADVLSADYAAEAVNAKSEI